MESVPKRKYILADKPERGLVRIVQIESGKTLLVPSEDIQKDIVHIRFLLDLESYPLASLQKDYTETGLELFSIEPYLIAGKDEDLSALLARENGKLEAAGTSLYS